MNIMYSVGDKVSHPIHGVATVADIVEQKIEGKMLKLYVLQLNNRNMTIMIPVEGCGNVGIRPIIDQNQAEKLLEQIRNIPIDDERNWGKRYRQNSEYLKSGDLLQVAKVIKCLTVRERDFGISAGERTMLAAAKKKLLTEIAVAKSCDYRQAELMVDGAIWHCV